MYYDTLTERYHSRQATLPVSRDQIQGLRVANDVTLAKAGIIPAVTDPIAEGMAASGGWTVSIIDGTAHRIPNVITQAEADALAATAAQVVVDNNIANLNITPRELLEVIVRIKNKNTPEQYKISAQEALDIVGLVLNEEE